MVETHNIIDDQLLWFLLRLQCLMSYGMTFNKKTEVNHQYNGRMVAELHLSEAILNCNSPSGGPDGPGY